MIAPVLTVLGSFFTTQLSAGVLRWIAMKAVLVGLFTVVLPIALIKSWMLIKEYVVSYAMSFITSLDFFESSTVVEMTGLGGYLFTVLKIPECVSIILSASVIAFILSFIRK